jgi:hypothetical protein
VVKRYVPDQTGSNHRLLFQLRQALQRVASSGQPVDFRAAFDVWWGAAQAHIKKDLGYDVYWDEFEAAASVKAGGVVDVLARVTASGYVLPPEADLVPPPVPRRPLSQSPANWRN